MAFQDVSRDIFDSWNEVGLVYTRNKYGRVSAPLGYGITDKNDCSYKISLFKGMQYTEWKKFLIVRHVSINNNWRR